MRLQHERAASASEAKTVGINVGPVDAGRTENSDIVGRALSLANKYRC